MRTAGSWHQGSEDLGSGASVARPAVSVAWPLGTGPEAPGAWLELFEGPLGRHAIVVLEGVLGRGELSRLGGLVGRVLGWGVRWMTIDLSRVDHLDYRGIPDFVRPLSAAEAGGAGFALVGASGYLRELFHVAGVEWDLLRGDGAGADCGAATAGGGAHGVAVAEPSPRPALAVLPGARE